MIYDAILKGLVFEGFHNQKTRIEFERNQVIKFQEFQKEVAANQRQTAAKLEYMQLASLRLTVILTIATSIAALYYIIEITKSFMGTK